jgi:hypothetical protein
MIQPLQLKEMALPDPIQGHEIGDAVEHTADPLRRRLMLFLHWQSFQAGGLRKFACDLVNRHLTTRLGSHTMHAEGITARTVYSGERFEKICGELNYYPHGSREHLEMMLVSASRPIDLVFDTRTQQDLDRDAAEARELLSPSRRNATAPKFLNACREKACSLSHHLRTLCTDPEAEWDVPYFSDLPSALEDCLRSQREAGMSSAAKTTIASRIEDALDFAYETRSCVLIHGNSRFGKSRGVERWVAANPDKARLISLKADSSQKEFYSAIARSIGCGDLQGMNVGDLRNEICNTVTHSGPHTCRRHAA